MSLILHCVVFGALVRIAFMRATAYLNFYAIIFLKVQYS